MLKRPKALVKQNVIVGSAARARGDNQRSASAPALGCSCASRIFLPSPQAPEQRRRGVYESFGLNACQIELVAHGQPKRDYYYQSRAGNRLFDLDLGPVALAFAIGRASCRERVCQYG